MVLMETLYSSEELFEEFTLFVLGGKNTKSI